MPSETLKLQALAEVVALLCKLEDYKTDINLKVDQVFESNLISDKAQQSAFKIVAKGLMENKIRQVQAQAYEVETLCRESDPQMSLFDYGQDENE